MPRHKARAAALLSPACVLLGVAVATSALAQAQPPGDRPWRVEHTVDGCEVGTRAVPGKEYVAARTTCVLPADLEVVARVLRDIERFPEWMADCSQTKVLKVVDPARDEYVFWFRQHVALFADRDVVLRSEVPVHEPDRRVIRAVSVSDVPHDARKGYVRMPSFASEWVLDRAGERRTRVTFMIDPDLGPGLPKGIANATIAKTTLRSVREGLARMVTRPEYLEDPRAATPPAPGATGAR